MPVYPNLKLIYIRIPKTAGEYFEKYINKYDTPISNIHPHATLLHITHGSSNAVVVPNIHEYTIVTIVRNPYDWFESLYNYTKLHKGFKNTWDDKIDDLIASKSIRAITIDMPTKLI